MSLKRSKMLVLAATAVIGLTGTAGAESGDAPENKDKSKFQLGLEKLFTEGTWVGNMRLRYEGVEQDTKMDGSAGTARFRIGYVTPSYGKFKFMVEGEAGAGAGNYNNTQNGNTGYPVIADPDDISLNQAWVSFGGVPNTMITAGRQRIVLDDQRFVGAVAWRNFEQTFDALSVASKFGEVDIAAGVIFNQNDIKNNDHEMSSPIVRMSYAPLGSKGRVTLYGYFVDYDNAADFGKSTQTVGGDFQGALNINDKSSVSYKAGYAQQRDMGQNPKDYQADRYILELGGKISRWKGGLGYEVLGADGAAGAAFITPLATLHKFQGWADMFLATPANGIEDKYASLNVGQLPWGLNATAVYHQFDSNINSINYGKEIDLAVAKSANIGKIKGVKFLVKAAFFDASDEFKMTGGKDTKKIWFQVGVPVFNKKK